MNKFDDIYNNLLLEFLGFGKKKEEDKPVGVKFTSLLAKGLIAKGFKKQSIDKGTQFVKDNGHGMTMTVSMGGDYKETPVSVLIKPGYGKEFYKNWNFTAHDVAFPYRGDVSSASFADRKKWSEESQQWEEEQRKKVGQIYDIVALFDDADVPKLQSMLNK